jgi:multidrug efflux pump
VPIFFVLVRGYFKDSERQRKLYAHELEAELPRGATAGDQV